MRLENVFVAREKVGYLIILIENFNAGSDMFSRTK